MKRTALFILLGALLFSAVPLTTDAGIVQCGGFEIGADGKYVEIRPLTDPVDNGWGKISNSEMAKLQPPCGFCDIFKLTTGIINFFLLPPPAGFGVVPLVATLLILVGGFYILIAAGRPDMQSKGKIILTAVVIGLLVVYIAWVVVNSILTLLGVAEWTGLTDNPDTKDVVEGWWQITCGI